MFRSRRNQPWWFRKLPSIRHHQLQRVEPCNDCPAPSTAQVVDSIGSDWFQDYDSRLTAYGGLDFDDLSTAGLQLLAQGDLLGLDTSVSTWRESGTSIRDHLWLGDANLVFQVIDRPRLKTRLGLGVNWLGDRWGGEAGFNLTASMDVKLNSRWTLTCEGDIGTLGDADLLHTKIAINRRLLDSQAEWTTGYERYDIDGVELQAVYTGLQFRF